MKKAFVLALSIVILCSCDPDVSGEGINLPPIEFAFKVSPDTAYMKVGDTLILYAAVSSTVENDIVLDDGKGEIFTYISISGGVPLKSSNDIKTALLNNDFSLIIEEGGIKSVENDIIRFTASPIGDSIVMHYKFVFLKKGLFRFGSFQPSFYEGSKGKTRWNAYFDVEDPHWDKFWEVEGNPAPTPSEDHYKRNYLVAVTD